MPSHETSAAGALASDVVAVCPVPALADLGTVFAIEAQGTALGAETACPSKCAFALPVISAAVSPVVTVTSLNTIRSKLAWWTRLRAVAANPAWVALARAVYRVTGAVVGAGAAECTALPIPATGTHFIAEGALKAWQAVTLPRDVVARPVAVHAVRASLATAVAKIPWRTDALASGAPVAWRTLTGALVWGTGRPVLTVTRQGAVRAPPALCTHTVTVDPCPSSQTSAVPCSRVASISMATVAALPAVKAIRAILAVRITPLPSPAGGAGAMAIQCVTGPSVPAQTGKVTAKAPRATGAVDGTVHSMPACFA